MKARAPGKLLVTGAYAVLRGAPAIVMAINRYAMADSERISALPSKEVALAFGTNAPSVDVSEFYDGSQKLGLGGSAAALVAAVMSKTESHGRHPTAVHTEVFARAKEIHRRAQGGGSGVDVAASTFGGVLRYQNGMPTKMPLPDACVIHAYWSGASARTSEMLTALEHYETLHQGEFQVAMTGLELASSRCVAAAEIGDAASFATACADYSSALTSLTVRSGVPIMPLAFQELHREASIQGASFFGSGAGGGDIGLFVGVSPPLAEFENAAEARGFRRLSFSIDQLGTTWLPA